VRSLLIDQKWLQPSPLATLVKPYRLEVLTRSPRPGQQGRRPSPHRDRAFRRLHHTTRNAREVPRPILVRTDTGECPP